MRGENIKLKGYIAAPFGEQILVGMPAHAAFKSP
jgi:hypothetical protein